MGNEQLNYITLESLATILGGAFLINVVILLLWFIIVLICPDWLYGITSKWFSIDKHEFDIINYGGIAFYKVINIAFFLCPYLSVKLLLRKKKRHN